MAQIILDSANNVIQGDFDTATLSLRTRMQTSTTNATTGVYAVPNGSATSASFQASNAADPTNASKIVMATNGSTDVQIVSGANGSGTYLPLSFYTNNDIRFQMGTAGQLGVRTGVGTVGYGTSGQFLTSGGPSGGVSWTTAAAGGFSNMTVFTSPGTFTTPASTTKVKVTMVGGGGGSGYAPGTGRSAGGGAGGYAQGIYNVTASTPYAVTAGAAGAGGSLPGSGGTGGTSSFGVLVSATGGGGGGAVGPGSTATGGAGGTGSLGLINIPGGSAAPNPPTGSVFIGVVPNSMLSAISYNGEQNNYGSGSTGNQSSPSGTNTPGVAGVVIVEY